MSTNPAAMAQLLASGLGGQQAPSGGAVQSQVSPLGGAAQLAQKIMLMQMLQNPQAPQGQPPNPMAQPNMMGGQMIQPQVPNAQQMPGVGQNA